MYIEIDGISKTYGRRVKALDDINMAIDKHEFISLLGPSGSGKTTLLRIIAGLETPSAGRVLIDGKDVTGQPPHQRGVAMVFQEFLLFPHRTVVENLSFPLRMLHLERGEIARRVGWALEILSLTGLENRYPRELSGGQQQRVALGRGLVASPKLLLLDEPLANLDRELRQEMEIEIRRYQKELGIPFIYVTHNQEEALSMSDRIAVMSMGDVEDFAERTIVYNHPKTPFIARFVGRSNAFHGRVRSVSSTAMVVDCNGIAVQASNVGARPGDEVDLYIKNEKISLLRGTAAGENAPACTVRDVILRGNFTEYLLAAANGQMLVAGLPAGAETFLPGENVTAVWDEAAVDAFVRRLQ
ncbi:ABC transporter ATP-binding protein [Paenirhodobacter populi]|uniref:ABC transporter ATP-binding protein n=1 Tax=Paenirhodobacter populi TaxID=2306993 RepID=A0A443IR15_9RHOB|nr:ABC transporter ATP-binding protein [Sinirhodobacter populi]RWR05479.1 ABC transporter ATP-binding protein [Sinirhodobacter populi]RWR09588.1 ABC transporter ATP-binding protein [Sinirhodobacter populi]